MHQWRRAMAGVGLVVATALSVVTPSAASTPPAKSTELVPVSVGEVDAAGLRWIQCVNGATHVTFRRTGNGCEAGLDSVGFAALTRQPGGYRLQVCAQQTDTIGMWVDPADSNGGSTGDTIYYSDPPYGPCYNRDIGYRIRKFQTVHLWSNSDRVDFSSWFRAPPW